MESKDDKDEIGLKDLVLYAPLGLVYDFQKVVPQLAKRGKSQVQLGLFLGRMAASRGQSTAERATADVLTTLATITARGITEFGQVVGLASYHRGKGKVDCLRQDGEQASEQEGCEQEVLTS